LRVSAKARDLGRSPKYIKGAIQIKIIHFDLTALPEDENRNKLFRIFKRCVEQHCPAEVSKESGEIRISAVLDSGMADEAFDISDGSNGIVIKGKNFNSLMFGMGKLLHSSHYGEDGIQITDWRGYSAPDCPIRSIYFAMHFHNWYHTAAPEELEEYFEDLMLWGYNGVSGILPLLNLKGWDDPNAEQSFLLLEKLLLAAKSLNLDTSIMLDNTDFMVPRKDLAADMSGIFCKTGNTVCPSTEEGYEYLLEINSVIAERLSKIGIDYLIFFPYDEGGCSCEKCAPWGGNGYYRYAKRLYFDLKKYLPDAKAMLATWHFDKGFNDKRDFPFLDRAIREDKEKGLDWVSYIMLETRNGMPEYIKEHGVPGGLNAIDFPEITMQKLEPWGGWGAVCTPGELSRIWDETQSIMHGGIPYSEGRYDDLNKAVMAGFLWQRDKKAIDIFREYCGYEFKEEIADELYEMCLLLEKNQFRTNVAVREPADMNEIKRARELAVKMDESLPENIKTGWRWRIFYIRALLDFERYAGAAKRGFDFYGLTSVSRFIYWRQFILGSRLAQKLLRELLDIAKAPIPFIPKDHYGHQYVRPNYTGIIENFDSYYDKNFKK